MCCARIERAARACGRDPGDVRLVAVGKTFPPEALRAVHALGQRAFGENYVQEGVAKMESLADLTDVEWHLIGPLQSNKAGAAAARFGWVQTVDRAKIAARLSAARPAAAPPLNVCVEVNASGETSKHGVAPDAAVGAGAGCRGIAPFDAARNHGHPRAYGGFRAASGAVPDPAPELRRVPRGRPAGGYAVDGDVGRSRGGDRRGRDDGADRYVDFRGPRCEDIIVMPIVFVGGGNMASALIGGMLARGATPADFRVVEPLADARERIAARFPGIAIHGTCTRDAVTGAALVVLAVKPQQMRAAAEALAPHLTGVPVPVVLSIAAGIRLFDLSRWLYGHGRLVRAMPNTPALVGKGISGVFAAASVDAEGRDLVSSVLAAAGEQVWVDDETMLDAVTAVSGSGPAYVFYFLEALEAAARDLGFTPDDARRLAYTTFAGAIALAEASEVEPAVLRAQVTSKGGTTERALASMEVDAVKAKIVAAVKAAAQRAGELGDTFGRDA